MAAPDFIQVRCANTDHGSCTTCARDFIIPINAIEGVFRTSDDKAEIGIKNSHFCWDPICLGPNGPRPNEGNRYIKTDAAWATVVTALDGKVENIGNITMVSV